ncbi:MAG: response regulator [Verrucomicrobiaceae bacterium]|nr:MAG: response regulator [Verrucomicrobiaceae bacterium]
MNTHASEPPRLHILVVENHPDTLKYLTLYLEQLGHTVSAARSLKEALELASSEKCHVLMSDIGLPDGDGWELLRRAQFHEPVYSIAMSGFGTSGDRLKSKEAGYRHHILKPFNPDELDLLLEEAAREAAGVKST